MAYYRCYFIDEASHVHDFAEFDCTDDEQALSRARRLCPSHVADGFELWQQVRLVHRCVRFDPGNDDGLPPPSPPHLDGSPAPDLI